MKWSKYSTLKTAKKVAFSKEKETVREEVKEVKDSDGNVTTPAQAKEEREYVALVQKLFESETGEALDDSKQDQLAYTPQLLEDLRENNSLVFLNFTADWCITCKVNESVALKTSKVRKLLTDKDITYIEADWTRKDPVISSALEEYGRTGLPLYLLFPSKGDPLILPEILTEDILISYLSEVQ